MSSSVVVVGAAGYIGQAVALAFRRAGFKVYGVVRNEEKAKILKQNEVHIIVGDIKSPDTFKDHLKHAAVVIDAVGRSDNKLLETLTAVTKGKSTKTLYILTSGILVYGSSPHVRDETHETNSPLLGARAAFEKSVTSSKDVRGVVIRPGFVYGGAGGFFADTAFALKQDADLTLMGRRDKRWSWVHVEDLADAYVRVAKAGHTVDGEIFDIIGPWAPTYEEISVAFAKASGWTGNIVHVPELPKDNFALQLFEANCISNSKKAANLLGWHESHLGPVAEASTYFNSWKASKAK